MMLNKQGAINGLHEVSGFSASLQDITSFCRKFEIWVAVSLEWPPDTAIAFAARDDKTALAYDEGDKETSWIPPK